MGILKEDVYDGINDLDKEYLFVGEFDVVAIKTKKEIIDDVCAQDEEEIESTKEEVDLNNEKEFVNYFNNLGWGVYPLTSNSIDIFLNILEDGQLDYFMKKEDQEKLKRITNELVFSEAQ